VLQYIEIIKIVKQRQKNISKQINIQMIEKYEYKNVIKIKN